MTATERRFTFNEIADRYAAARPGYPDAVFEAIAAVANGIASPRLLELGAGTGKATVGLVKQGFEVTAIEPGPAMIDQSRRLPELANVCFLETTFEAWEASTEPPFQVVSAAQAWHWVDPAIGYRKAASVLERGGALAIFGTVSPFPPGAMKDAVDAVYRQRAPEMDRAGGALETYYTPLGPIPSEIAGSGCYGPVECETFPWTQTYRTADFLALISTFSDHQMLGEVRLRPLLDELGDVIEAHGGRVELPSETNLFLARKP